MCTSTPKMPAPAAPMQEQKAPDTANARRRKGAPMAGGTLLTGPSGLAGNAMNTGGTTLLGG